MCQAHSNFYDLSLVFRRGFLKFFDPIVREAMCWRCVSTNVDAVYRYHTQHTATLCPPRSTLATVVVKNCQGYKKYKNRHADLKF